MENSRGWCNQIYYITINKRFCNSIEQVKGCPGADGGSYYVHIVAILILKLRRMHWKKTSRHAASGVASHGGKILEAVPAVHKFGVEAAWCQLVCC